MWILECPGIQHLQAPNRASAQGGIAKRGLPRHPLACVAISERGLDAHQESGGEELSSQQIWPLQCAALHPTTAPHRVQSPWKSARGNLAGLVDVPQGRSGSAQDRLRTVRHRSTVTGQADTDICRIVVAVVLVHGECIRTGRIECIDDGATAVQRTVQALCLILI